MKDTTAVPFVWCPRISPRNSKSHFPFRPSYYNPSGRCFSCLIFEATQHKGRKPKDLCLAQRRQDRKGEHTAVLSSWRSSRLGERTGLVAAAGRAGLFVTFVVKNRSGVVRRQDLFLRFAPRRARSPRREMPQNAALCQLGISIIGDYRQFVAP